MINTLFFTIYLLQSYFKDKFKNEKFNVVHILILNNEVSGRSLILAQPAQSAQSAQFYFLIADLN